MQVLAKLGTPSEEATNGAIVEYHYRDTEYSYTLPYWNWDVVPVYGDFDNAFRFDENGQFQSFVIETPDFPVCTEHGGGIKVGDDITKFTNWYTASGFIGEYELSPDYESSIYYLLKPEQQIALRVKCSFADNIVTSISYMP